MFFFKSIHKVIIEIWHRFVIKNW